MTESDTEEELTLASISDVVAYFESIRCPPDKIICPPWHRELFKDMLDEDGKLWGIPVLMIDEEALSVNYKSSYAWWYGEWFWKLSSQWDKKLMVLFEEVI